ncbi:hypothetical protein [Georgenia subflava]|uniref:Uncharacterized protein n=1 Tax=Georgenia subflava TaxID=1622177 RepID=A0A6N7EJA9_9MICO|nr:hypothetical protein [Georgenia subflava]MPV36827.1 hypothetical protein [Georgenia subflava]
MTNWADLRDAYGSAEKVPAMLVAAEESGVELGPAWDAAWSHLCHQGTVYSASYEAIPLLADICSRLPMRGYMPGLQLAGSILASIYGPVSPTEVRATFATAISRLRDIAESALPLAEGDPEFTYALETLAAFEDLGVWQRTLSYLADGEAPLICDPCGAELLLQLDESPPKVATWNAGDGKRDVVGMEPTHGTAEARLWGLADTHGRAAVAESLRFYFGSSTCPACGNELSIPEAFA